jgi:hypothetical protein
MNSTQTPKDPTYGLSVTLLAALASVHPDTARRWKREKRIPPPYDFLVQLRNRCDIGSLSEPWFGWVLRKGLLVSPEGTGVTPGQVRAIPIQLQLIRALERERATPLQRRLDFD